MVALESILARGRMKEIADLTSRVNDLERTEQRRLSLEIKASDHRLATRNSSKKKTPQFPFVVMTNLGPRARRKMTTGLPKVLV